MSDNSQEHHIQGTLSQGNGLDKALSWTPEVASATRPWGQLVLTIKAYKTLGIRHRGTGYADGESHIFDHLPILDLFKDEYSVGKQGCNLNLTVKEISSNLLQQISRTHFLIRRKRIHDFPVYLEDRSRNGTFVNGEKIGHGKTRILETLDEISMGNNSSRVFIFHDWLTAAHSEIPSCIRVVYFISEQIGSGASGVVHSIFNKRSCNKYAMKYIIKDKEIEGQDSLNNPKRIMNEIKIMKKLNHPFVINIHDIVDTPVAVYLIMEYMDGGDLYNHVIRNNHLKEFDAKLIFYQIADAVKYLHEQNIAHRDLKPHNILLQHLPRGTFIRVSDFGLSKFIEDAQLLKTKCGTAMYIAPEVVKNNVGYTKKADVWSLGVMLYFSLCGYEPFSKDLDLGEQICRGTYSYDKSNWEAVSRDSKNIIDKMLIVDENKRCTVEEILKDEWLQDKQLEKLIGIHKTSRCPKVEKKISE